MIYMLINKLVIYIAVLSKYSISVKDSYIIKTIYIRKRKHRDSKSEWIILPNHQLRY